MHAESQEPRHEGRRPSAGAISGAEGTDMRSGSGRNAGPRRSLSLRAGRAGGFLRRLRNIFPCTLLVMAVLLMSACNLPKTPNPTSTSNPVPPTLNPTPPIPSPEQCRVDWGGGVGDTDPELVARAEDMLSEHGVTITDATGDWIWPGNPEDNPSPYPVPWADLTSVTFAVDADYLYVRLTVNGVYPRTEAELPWYGQDQIRKLNIDIGLDTDNNPQTGSLADGGSEVMLGSGMYMAPMCGWMDMYDFWYGPTGIDTPETERYAHMNDRDLVVAAWGGAGSDYRDIVYPVQYLGLHPGQAIAVNGWDECASVQYEDRHATFDVLGTGGMNTRVVIQLPY
jgi:hypothetical protein